MNPSDDLARALDDLGAHLDHPAGEDLAARVVASLGAGSVAPDSAAAVPAGALRSRWLVVPAMAAALLLFALVVTRTPEDPEVRSADGVGGSTVPAAPPVGGEDRGGSGPAVEAGTTTTLVPGEGAPEGPTVGATGAPTVSLGGGTRSPGGGGSSPVTGPARSDPSVPTTTSPTTLPTTTLPPGPGQITTVAGNGVAAFGGDGGPASAALLARPGGVAVDANGNLFIADGDNHRIRRVDRSGTITTYAGTGAAGHDGDGGPATAATFRRPSRLRVTPGGDLLVLDTGFEPPVAIVRRITPTGMVSTLLSTDRSLNDLAVAPDGTVFVADPLQVFAVGGNGSLTVVAGDGWSRSAGDGGPATAASFQYIQSLAVDTSGRLYIGDPGAVRRVDAAGIVTTFARPVTTSEPLMSMAFGPDGALFLTTGTSRLVVRVDPGGSSRVVAGDRPTAIPSELEFGNRGGLYAWCDAVPGRCVGDGGSASEARFGEIAQIAVDAAGNLYIGDDYCSWVYAFECASHPNVPTNRVRKIIAPV